MHTRPASPRSRSILRPAFLLLCCFFGGAFAATAETPSLEVSDTLDPGSPTDGTTSLREALAYAAQLGGVGQTVTFASSFFDGAVRTITLAGQQIEIDNIVTITGPGADKLIVSGNNASRVFRTGNAATLNVEGLTLTGGNGVGTPSSGRGGVIYNTGAVTLKQCIVTGNHYTGSAGALCNDGAGMSLVDCTVSNNVVNSPAGASAAAIDNAGTGPVIIINSTVTGNQVTGDGSAGALRSAGTAYIYNSTFTANSANGVGGAGGIYGVSGTLRVIHSIVAGNPGTGGAAVDVAGAFVSDGHNLIGVGGGTSAFTNGVNGDQVGTAASPLDAKLDSNGLQNNGGRMATIRLLPGSPAIDAGDPNFNPNFVFPALTTDQRGPGFTRVVKAKASSAEAILDIGAFEVQLPVITFAAGVKTNGLTVDVSSAPIDLDGGSVSPMPPGGIFTGAGVQDNLFDLAKMATGTYTILYTAPADAYGNIPPAQFFQIHVVAANPYLRVVATLKPKGLGADVPGELAGTKFTQFGLPSVDDAQLGARVKIKPADGKEIPAIFAGDLRDSGIVVRAGDAAPAVGGTLGTFKTFDEPVFGGGFALAFTATLAGAPAASATGLWSSVTGGLELVAGHDVPVRDTNGDPLIGPIFDKVQGYALSADGSTLTFLATLKGPGVKPANKTGIWQQTPAGTKLIFRTGDICDLASNTFGFGSDLVQSLALFAPAKTIPGQRRSYAGSNGVVQALATFAKGRQAILTSTDNGTHSVSLQSTVGKLGLPATNRFGKFALRSGLAVGSTVPTPPSPVTARDDQAILVGTDPTLFKIIARENTPVSFTVADLFTAFEEPAHNDRGATAFFAKVKAEAPPALPASQTSVLIFNRPIAPNNNLESKVLARTGTPAAGLSNGEQWKSFTAMALPDSAYGPVFLAKLSGPGVKASNGIGLWAMDASENLRLLVRAGDTLSINGENKTVSLITTLGAAKDSAGQGRYVDRQGSVSAVLTFTDHSTALVHFGMPTPVP